MAFTLSNLRTQFSAGPAASLVGATVSAAIGDIVVVKVAAANSGTSGAAVTTTCTDSAGNTYTQRSQVNNTAGVADDGITLTIFTSKLTSTLSNGDITVSFSPSSVQGCAFTAIRYRPASGEVANFIEAGPGAIGNSTTPSITATSVNDLDLIIGCIAEEAGTTINADADTTDGTWSTKYEQSIGSGATAAHIVSQSKAVFATGAQTFNPTTTAAHDFAINYIILRSGAAINEVTAGVGSYAVTGTAATFNIFLDNGILVANAGAYSISGVAATFINSGTLSLVVDPGSYLTDVEGLILRPTGTSAGKNQFTVLRRPGDPLYEQIIIWSDFNLIYETDPDQFERLEYIGISTVEGISSHVFRIHFRDLKTFATTLGSNPFSMTNGSPVVRVAHTAHGRRTGEYVRYSGAGTAGGFQINGSSAYEYQITYVSDNTYDITHRSSFVLNSNNFATTNASAVVRVTHTAHGRSTGNTVFFSDVDSVGGIKIAGSYSMTVINANTYDITHSSAATSTTTGGGTSTTATYDIPATSTVTGGGASVLATYNEFKIILNASFGSEAAAEALALLVAPRLGKLPRLYRQHTNRVFIRPGNVAFSAGEAQFTLSADRIAVRIAYNDLEESCLHEGTHAAIQEFYQGKGIPYIDDPGWTAAVAADDAFIDDYASSANQEDFAQSALASYAMITHPERFPETDRTLISNQIPNRIEFFRDVVWIDPVTACVRVPAANVAGKLPTGWIASLVDNTALASHCRDLANLNVEAYYSRPDLAAAGIPDLYKFFCTVCGRAHVRPCIGSEPRPFWEVR